MSVISMVFHPRSPDSVALPISPYLNTSPLDKKTGISGSAKEDFVEESWKKGVKR